MQHPAPKRPFIGQRAAGGRGETPLPPEPPHPPLGFRNPTLTLIRPRQIDPPHKAYAFRRNLKKIALARYLITPNLISLTNRLNNPRQPGIRSKIGLYPIADAGRAANSALIHSRHIGASSAFACHEINLSC